MTVSRLIALVLYLSIFTTGQLADLVRAAENCPQVPAGYQLRILKDAQGEHRYLVFLPAQYDAAKKWPVALFLHGAGERGTDGIIQSCSRLSVALDKWPDTPFIAVFPQCEAVTGRALTGWLADSPDGLRALAMLAAVEKEFSVDTSHRMLIGWSMGGYGAWSMAATHPEMWSAVMVLAGGALGDHLPLEELARRRVPVWAISARGDPLIPFSRSEKLIEQLKQAGGQGHFTLLESDDHDVSRTAFAASQTLQWLLNPKSVDPASVDFSHLTPLPPYTRFYEQCLVTDRVIPAALAMRLGNAPFEALAGDLPSLLTNEPRSGTVADIERSVGSGEDCIRVRLMDVSYQYHIQRVWLHGISGGRLGLDVEFRPLTFTIGKTSLDSRKHQAKTGPIEVRIGIHRPAVLKLEVQPVVDNGKFHLRLLRKGFFFDDGNWYIQPPQQVEAHSEEFTPDQLVTGIVGSLYSGRQELVDQLLAMVPELLQRAEQEIRMRDAPELARLLSPLPVLIPDVKVSPAMIRTDRQGLSAICDLNVSVRGNPPAVVPLYRLQLANIPADNRLSAEVALDAMTRVSLLNVEQNFAQVNVLDVSEDKFARLADPATINEILPELKLTAEDQVTAMLRLLDPIVVTRSAQPAIAGTSQIVLKSSGISIDFYRLDRATAKQLPVSRIVFSLSQEITIADPVDRSAAAAALTLRWAPAVDVRFVRVEPIAGETPQRVDGEKFVKVLSDAWSAWGQANGEQKIPLTVARLGSRRVMIESLRVSDQEIGLQFNTAPEPAPVVEEESDVSSNP